MSTRKEKQLRRLYSNITAVLFITIMQFGGKIFWHNLSEMPFFADNNNYKLILKVNLLTYLLAILIGIIYAFSIRKKEKRNKLNAFQWILSYVLLFSSLGFSSLTFEDSLYIELFIYLYISLVTTVVLRYAIFTSDNIDRAVIYFEEEPENEDEPQPKKVYVYHKVEDKYAICGEERIMKDPCMVKEIAEIFEKDIKYIKK